MATILGIDSGATGALAFINDKGSLLNCYDMPFVDKFKIKHVDVFDLFNIIMKNEPDYIYIEEVRGIRGMSTMQTAFVQGGHYHPVGCAVYSYLVAKNMEDDDFRLVTPQVWKRALNVQGGATGKKKDKTIDMVKSIYSSQKALYTGSRGGIKDGRTDAIAIALYGLKDLKKRGLV